MFEINCNGVRLSVSGCSSKNKNVFAFCGISHQSHDAPPRRAAPSPTANSDTDERDEAAAALPPHQRCRVEGGGVKRRVTGGSSFLDSPLHYFSASVRRLTRRISSSFAVRPLTERFFASFSPASYLYTHSVYLVGFIINGYAQGGTFVSLLLKNGRWFSFHVETFPACSLHI